MGEDAPGHHAPPAVEHSAPHIDHSPPQPHTPLAVEHPADTFDPNQGKHYTSGDPHYPGGWPPGTPEATWTKGDTDPAGTTSTEANDRGCPTKNRFREPNGSLTDESPNTHSSTPTRARL
ncbi:hypothetical protein MABM_31580 [Mycobacteroides abscessus]|nr:hypothetical protein MABM_31580 [Mycobacteroides abscessus]